MKVKLEPNESSDSLIRRFMKKVKKSTIMDDLFERKFYKKPSEVKKEKERQRERVLRKLREEKQGTID